MEYVIMGAIMVVIGLFYWSGYRDDKIDDRYKQMNEKGDKWVP